MNTIRVVCFGEILWDNLKQGRRLGGAPLNVCYHLIKSGIQSSIISQVGNDRNGIDILRELTSLGVDPIHCYVTNDRPTSTVEVHTLSDQQVTYEIVENVAWDNIRITPVMEQLVDHSDALVFGSLITRSTVSRTTLFKLMAHSKFRVFDMNLRAPFYSKELIMLLLEQTNLLKLNEDELIRIMEWLNVSSVLNVKEQLQAIQSHFSGIKEIILTLGAEGSIYHSHNQHISIKANKVTVKDTVGSGDSFLAAFLSGKLKGKPIREALDQANLLSGFIASQYGACPVYNNEDLINFKASIEIINQ